METPKWSTRRSRGNQVAFVHDSLEAIDSLHVFGEIDISSSHEFEECVQSISQPARPIVVDLTRCTYLDSSALHILEQVSKKFDLRVVAAADGAVQRVFEIVNAAGFLSITYVRIASIRPSERNWTEALR